MSIADGKCPNCGANIKIDTDKDTGICEYCGSAFVTEKAIINYGTYINKQEIHNVKEDNEWTYKSKKDDHLLLYVGAALLSMLMLVILILFG